MTTQIFGKENFLEISDVVAKLENERKDIADDIKSRIVGCSEQFGVDKKVLTRAIKSYLKYKVDQATYLVMEGEVDKILDKVIIK